MKSCNAAQRVQVAVDYASRRARKARASNIYPQTKTKKQKHATDLLDSVEAERKRWRLLHIFGSSLELELDFFPCFFFQLDRWCYYLPFERMTGKT